MNNNEPRATNNELFEFFEKLPSWPGGVATATPLLPEEGWPKAGVEGDGVVVLTES